MSEERVLSLFVDDRAGQTLPVFLSLLAYDTGEADGHVWYSIEACNLEGTRLCKPRVFGSARLARERWFEAVGGAELLDEALFRFPRTG